MRPDYLILFMMIFMTFAVVLFVTHPCVETASIVALLILASCCIDDPTDYTGKG